MIPYGRQDIAVEDITAVVEVMGSDWLTQGPKGPEFEKSVARHCGARYAVAVNSATSALHLACVALEVGPGDVVWTTPITFVASANCALYCGAGVDFVDIDLQTGNLGPDTFAAKLAHAEKAGALPKVVIPVHLCGQSCEMKVIHELSRRYGFHLIEDASHAIGGRYRHMPIGCCRYSDITVFSFHPVKIITTGEGGMALTNDAELAARMTRLRSHGIIRDPAEMEKEPDGPWYYEQVELGYNYRMSDLQAALGISQMDRLCQFVERRQTLARRYDRLLAGLPVQPLWQHPDCQSSRHLYVIRLRLDDMEVTHREVFTALREHGIGVQLHYIPLYRQPYFQRMGFAREQYPQAEQYYAEAISLPLFPALTEDEQDKVVDTLHRVVS